VTMGRAATSGVLFHDAEAIESLQRIDTLVVDKTGTLTAGAPAFDSIVVAPGSGGSRFAGALDETEVLRLAASLERASEHPIARAIGAEAGRRGLALVEPSGFASSAGSGVHGTVEGHEILIGNGLAMMEAHVDATPMLAQAEARRADGATVVFVAVDGALAGMLSVSDPIRESAREAVQQLEAEGIRVVMASGDGLATARAVAAKLGIAEVRGEMRPADKLAWVESLQREGHRVAMAGDGINDAPALARADVGIAMGTGTDVAMASGKVTLVKGDLRGIVRARDLSRAAVANMRQNLAFAFLYNALGVPIAAGVLYPAFGLLLSPMLAAVAMSFSSVSVVGNALRLRRA